MTPRGIGILANLEKSGVEEIFGRISAWAARQGYDIISNAGENGSGSPAAGNPFGLHDPTELARRFADTKFLITLGGDGTLLYAAQLVAAAQIPVLSVNLGSLGFHTQVSPDNLDECLKQLEAGNSMIENRMMLQVELPGDSGELQKQIALNDIVISKNAWGHMVTLHIGVDGQVLTDVAADALIISSPTGSSAYNYAAGGPVLSPAMDAMILNALCAHRMRVSPLVMPGNARIEVNLRPRRPDDSAQVLTDGQPWKSIADEETLKISSADMYLPLMVFENDFYGKLRNKLRWGGLF